MKKLVGALLLVFLMCSPGYAQSCDDNTIQSVSSDGSVIIMLSGAVFQVDVVDQVDTALWLATEDVLICDGDTKIINKDDNGEHAAVKRLR